MVTRLLLSPAFGRGKAGGGARVSMAGEERDGARLALASLPGAPRDPLHLLPCSVQHQGPAAVQRYFAPAVRRHPEGPDDE
ncbi:putative Ribonuclease H2 subunit C-like protein [Naja naja]|nr:putative Ribonuclease H2 subunit C-like protein [Naja naja]